MMSKKRKEKKKKGVLFLDLVQLMFQHSLSPLFQSEKYQHSFDLHFGVVCVHCITLVLRQNVCEDSKSLTMLEKYLRNRILEKYLRIIES